ncbi:MAG: hypothetical protein GF411_20390 [Candidatus Lokiarchaeota archaeon]|nr:hypothetical protein [Candidatus Lokiarchaeota archaeon]
MTERTYRIKVRTNNAEIELEGDKPFVKDTFDELRSILAGKSKLVKTAKEVPKKKPGRKPKKTAKKATKGKRTDLGNVSLTELFEKKNATRKRHSILMLAFFVNKVKGKIEFRGMDLKPLYKEISMKPPKNFSYFLRKMVDEKPKLLEKGKKQGRYKITDEGVEYIYEEIPDA